MRAGPCSDQRHRASEMLLSPPIGGDVDPKATDLGMSPPEVRGKVVTKRLVGMVDSESVEGRLA